MTVERRITDARYLRDRNLIEVTVNIRTVLTPTKGVTETSEEVQRVYIPPTTGLNKEKLMAKIKTAFDGKDDAEIDIAVASVVNETF